MCHINAVDELTQWEVLRAAEKITDKYLLPLLEKIITTYSYRIINFHCDSRPRHTNALIETKNGWIVRKWPGYSHIKKEHANQINDFYFNYFHEYLKLHRSCAFAGEVINNKGKIKEKYQYQDSQIPYENQRSLPDIQK